MTAMAQALSAALLDFVWQGLAGGLSVMDSSLRLEEPFGARTLRWQAAWRWR